MTSSRCPECGASLSADAPEGLCPQCLFKGVISSAHEAAQSARGEATGAYAGPSAPSFAELAPLFPQLEIIELIGQGGMGAVYKARQPALDRVVAVKVLPPEAGQDPAFAERFSREARALARLNHPNIVAIHNVGKAGDFYYFVMEYVEGANLRQVLRDGKLRPEQALRIVPQICEALQYAHEEGIVHRDIKPENILLDKKGRVKLADFGLAKLLGRETGNFTLTGSRQVVGTLYYMAPEQMDRPLEVDHRADIYSLGVVFYEMLTGQLPVGRFPMPSETAGTDAFLDEVVMRAMQREPANRYQHASEVKTDVESHARGAARASARLPRGPGPLSPHVFSRTKWAILCCLIGFIASLFLPWMQVRVEGRSRSVTEQGKPIGQMPIGTPGAYTVQFYSPLGSETWQGVVAATLWLLLCVSLITASSLHPTPVWCALIIVGTALALFALPLFLYASKHEVVAESQARFGDMTVTGASITPMWGSLIAMIVALLLILRGAVQLRGALRHGQEAWRDSS
jgi:predicted Ser/Thr protein kinase